MSSEIELDHSDAPWPHDLAKQESVYDERMDGGDMTGDDDEEVTFFPPPKHPVLMVVISIAIWAVFLGTLTLGLLAIIKWLAPIVILLTKGLGI